MRNSLRASAGTASGIPAEPTLTPEKLPRASTALLIEQWYPWVLGLVGFGVAWRWPETWLIGHSWRASVLDHVITALSIFVAYLATAVTIIPAIEEKSIIRKLRHFGYLRIVVGYIAAAIWSSGLLLIVSVIVAAIPDKKVDLILLNHASSAIWWGMLFLALASIVRALRLLLKAILAY